MMLLGDSGTESGVFTSDLKGVWSGVLREWQSLPLQTFSEGVGWKEC